MNLNKQSWSWVTTAVFQCDGCSQLRLAWLDVHYPASYCL